MPLTPGVRFGAYEVTAKVGAGGMGEVYRARDTTLGRTVALKALAGSFPDDADRLARFEREAQLLASLNHPNIAHIFGVEDSGGTRAIVMEFVDGEDLAQRIARGPIPLDEAVPIVRQVAEALEAAHEQGIVHRDLKPANVKVRPDGVVKVLDFGLAKAVEVSAGSQASANDLTNSPTITSPAMTRAGVILGTAAYMSPEQAKGLTVDKRCDIWAFGCLLYEMLTTVRAYGRDDVVETLAAVLTASPDWSVLSAATPTPIRHLIERCLEKDVRKRLRDIGEARIVLSTMTLDGAPATAPVRPPPVRWSGSTIAAAVVTTAILGGSALFIATRTRSGMPTDSRLSDVRFEIPFPRDMTFGDGPPAPLPSMSPDGRCTAFNAFPVGNAALQLWVRCLNDLEPHKLADSLPGSSSFWSPDGRYVAFTDRRGYLARVLASGGPVETVVQATGSSGDWSAQGDIVFSTGAGPIERVLAGGKHEAVTALRPGETAHGQPSFLPDAKHFLYVAQPGDALHVGSIDGKSSISLDLSDVVRPIFVAPGYVMYVSQQHLVARPFDDKALRFTADPVQLAANVRSNARTGLAAYAATSAGSLVYRPDRGRTIEVEWTDRTGRTVSRPVKPGAYRIAEPSPAGNRIALRGLDPLVGGVLSLVDANGGSARVTGGAGNELSPRWSPDGKAIVFGSYNGPGALVVQRLGSTAAPDILLASQTEAFAPTDWSADGRFIVYEQSTPSTQSDIWVLPLEGDRKPLSFLRTPFNEGQGVLSADNKWMAYASDESGQLEVYVQPNPPTGEKIQISNSGGRQPRWRRDGKELFFLDLPGAITSASIQVNGNRIQASRPQKLFDTRVGASVADVNPTIEAAQFAVSADGQRFLISNRSASADTEPLVFVLNWQALLTK